MASEEQDRHRWLLLPERLSQECILSKEHSHGHQDIDRKLCEFCEPRILDLSKLGWKEKTDENGKTFLEPETIVGSDGEAYLKPWKDENAFGPRTEISKRYNESGTVITPIKGISVSDREINIEYFRKDQLPDFPFLQDSSEAGCCFCSVVREFLHADESWVDESVYIWSLTYIFKPQIETRDMRVSNGRTLRLHSLNLNYQFGLGPSAELWTRSGVIASTSDIGDLLNIQARPIESDVLHPSKVSLVRSWMEQCQKSDEHHTCQSHFSSLQQPRRLLDIRILDGDSNKIRLVNTTECAHEYAALSYCWGTRQKTLPPLKTTNANLARHMDYIPQDDLPACFKLVIEVARRLQIMFLWIDSLCIIQDDNDDWATEAAKMSSVYKNAVVTFVTAMASSPHDKIQFREEVHAWTEIPWVFPGHAVYKGNYLLDRNRNKDPDDREDKHDWSFDNGIYVHWSQWNTRGWTFQERYLSRRLVYFGNNALYWECQVARAEETLIRVQTKDLLSIKDCYHEAMDSASMLIREYIFTGATPNDMTAQGLLNLWYRLVENYGNRELTFASDVIAALGGMAKEMAGLLQRLDPLIDITYLSGTWKVEILRGILWYRPTHAYLEYPKGWVTFLPARCQLLEAPLSASWLWDCVPLSNCNDPESVRTALSFVFYRSSANDDSRIVLEDIRIKPNSKVVDAYTFAGTHGSIHLRGLLTKITFQSMIPKHPEFSHSHLVDLEFWKSEPGHYPDRIYINWTQPDFDLYVGNNLEIFGLCVYRGRVNYEEFLSEGELFDCALLLVRAGNAEGSEVWRRIGLGIFYLEKEYSRERVPSIFEDAEMTRVVII